MPKTKNIKSQPQLTGTLKKIKTIVMELLKLLGVKQIKLKLNQDEEQVIHLDVNCENPALLIGFQGETISSLQLIISLLLYKKLGNWQKIVVNVADYRQKREEAMQKLALNSVQKVKFSKNEVVLANLSPGERRTIHMFLADHKEVTTQSEGEGRERVLIIKLKK